MADDVPLILTDKPVAQGSHVAYELHTLGWKAFQDLCLAIAEEILKRPVESFLPSRDGGRDGAFIGKWAGDAAAPEAGRSAIQCKFTSKRDASLRLPDLSGELEKVKRLARRGLAKDYVLLANHFVTGESAAEIVAAFEAAGVEKCRVFGGDWISDQIRSAGLRIGRPVTDPR